MLVRDVMTSNVITIPSDTPVLEAERILAFHKFERLPIVDKGKLVGLVTTAIAQKNRVGCLPVVEGDRVVGILTTNDIFYKVLNPLFGIGETGKRIIVYEGGEGDKMQRVLESINKLGLKIKTFWTIKSPDTDKNDLIVHLDAEDISQLISELKKLGFSVEEREFIP